MWGLSNYQGPVIIIIVKSCLGQWLLDMQEQLWQNPPCFTFSFSEIQISSWIFKISHSLVSLINYQGSRCAQFPGWPLKDWIVPFIHSFFFFFFDNTWCKYGAGPPALILDYEATGSEATNANLTDRKNWYCGDSLWPSMTSYKPPWSSAFSLPP